MEIRTKIWNDMLNAKFKYFYIDFIKNKFFRRQRSIDMSLLAVAVISASSWGISEMFPALWAGVIIAAHFFTIYKPFFDFGKYVQELNLKIALAETHINDYEKYWHDFEQKKLNEPIISDQYFMLRKRTSDIFKLSDEVIVSEDLERLGEKHANENMKTYLKNTFGVLQ